MPNGNTLLHIFGSWLFQATTHSHPDYSFGTSESLGILCRIFSQPQRRQPFLRTYLERFYTALREGFRGDSASVTAIVMNSSLLFAMELEGLRSIIPDVIQGLRRVLPRLQKGWVSIPSPEELRRGAVKILSSLICLGERFGSVKFQSIVSWGIGGGGEESLTKLIKQLYGKDRIESNATEYTFCDVSENSIFLHNFSQFLLK